MGFMVAIELTERELRRLDEMAGALLDPCLTVGEALTDCRARRHARSLPNELNRHGTPAPGDDGVLAGVDLDRVA